MRIPVHTRETDKFCFYLELPFREWRALKKAAHQQGIGVDEFLEQLIRRGMAAEKIMKDAIKELKLDN